MGCPQAVIENDDVLAPVGHLCILECHTEDKATHDTALPIRPVRPSSTQSSLGALEVPHLLGVMPANALPSIE